MFQILERALVPRKISPNTLLLAIPTTNREYLTYGLLKANNNKFRLIVHPNRVDLKTPCHMHLQDHMPSRLLHPVQRAYLTKTKIKPAILESVKILEQEGVPLNWPHARTRHHCGMTSLLYKAYPALYTSLLRSFLPIQEIENRIGVFSLRVEQVLTKWIRNNFDDEMIQNLEQANQLAHKVPFVPFRWMQEIIHEPKLLQWFSRYPDALRHTVARAHRKGGSHHLNPKQLFDDICSGEKDKTILDQHTQPNQPQDMAYRLLSKKELIVRAQRDHTWISQLFQLSPTEYYTAANKQLRPLGCPYPDHNLMEALHHKDIEMSYLDTKTGTLMTPAQAELTYITMNASSPNTTSNWSYQRPAIIDNNSYWGQHNLTDYIRFREDFYHPALKLASKEILTLPEHQHKDLYHHALDITGTIIREFSHFLVQLEELNLIQKSYTPTQVFRMGRAWENGLGKQIARIRKAYETASTKKQEAVQWLNAELKAPPNIQVKPLQTPQDMYKQGEISHNCLGNLVYQALDNSHFYAIKDICFQLHYNPNDNRWRLVEATGKRNKKIPQTKRKIIENMVANLQQRQESGVRDNPTKWEIASRKRAQKNQEQAKPTPEAIKQGKEQAIAHIKRRLPKL